MTIKEAIRKCVDSLLKCYPKGEAEAITEIVLEHITQKNRNEIKLFSERNLMPEEETLLDSMLERLNKFEPVQYIANEAWFYALPFYVDKNVLVPRPETEELVHWIIADNAKRKTDLKILDIGTGSGCIPVSLKSTIPGVEIWACDVSKVALAIAKKNADTNKVEINFQQIDFLNAESRSQLPVFDIIVSNPPYVPESDKTTMLSNVLSYEPHLALFVSNIDPLIFYKEIAVFSKEHLADNGLIYLEIHENYGNEVCQLFEEAGLRTELRKDMQLKDRMIKCRK